MLGAPKKAQAAFAAWVLAGLSPADLYSVRSVPLLPESCCLSPKA